MNQFDKTRSLLQKKEYEDVFKCAKKIVTPYFIVLYCPNTKGYSRLGLAISKKKIAKSHDRNRVKRIIRETFRTDPTLDTVDMVFVAKTGFSHLKNLLVREDVGHILSKLDGSQGVYVVLLLN